MENLKQLIGGYHQFRSSIYLKHDDTYKKLAKYGQSPKVMIIGCIDSRVDPTTIFNARPGELLIVRNVANIVPPLEEHNNIDSMATALQFGVEVIGVKLIVVLGHALCGGVASFLANNDQNIPDNQFIRPWISLLVSAKNELSCTENEVNKEKLCRALELQSIKQSIKNLNTYPFIKDQFERKKLKLEGAYFDVSMGELLVLNNQSGKYEKV